MNKAALNRALRKRPQPSGPFVMTQSIVANQSPAPTPKLVTKSTGVKKDFERDLQGAKLAGGTGDHKLALTNYLALLHDFKDSAELKTPKAKANVLLQVVKEAQLAGDISTAKHSLLQALALSPGSPQVHKVAADLAEAMGDVNELVLSLGRLVEIVESKGNYNRSAPLRLRLSAAQERMGDSVTALRTLTVYLSNPKVQMESDDKALTEMRTRVKVLEGGGDGVAEMEVEDRSTYADDNNNESASLLHPRSSHSPTASPSHPSSNSNSIPAASQGQRRYSVAEEELLSSTTVQGPVVFPTLKPSRPHSGSQDTSSLIEKILFHRQDTAKVAEMMASRTGDTGSVVCELESMFPKMEALEGLHSLSHLPAAEPYIVSLLPSLLDLSEQDSEKPAVREAAERVISSLVRRLNRYGLRIVLPILLDNIGSRNWRAKVVSLNAIFLFAKHNPSQVAVALPEIVPVTSAVVWDTKREVRAASKRALHAACACIANPDIEPVVDQLVSVIGNPDETQSALDTLMATTFVAVVDIATLSVIAPLLGKCLRERNSAYRRKASCVVSNMCRLVEDPSD
eukprot:243794_1